MLTDFLPDIILENIFSFLKAKNILLASVVCKKWNKIINRSTCWKNVDFSEISINFGTENLKNIKKLIGPCTKAIRFDDNTSNEVNNIVILCNIAEELCLSNIRMYSDINILFWPRYLMKLEIRDTDLKEGIFHRLYLSNGILFPILQNLVIINQYIVSDNDIQAILASKTIKSLKLKYCSTFSINALIEFCPKLVYIDLHWGYVEVDDTKLLLYMWPNTLKSIKLNNLPNSTAVTRTNSPPSKISNKLEPVFIHLRQLHLKNCNSFNTRSLNCMVKYGNITHISLENVTVSIINNIIQYSKALVSISLKLIFGPKEKEKFDFSTWPDSLKVIDLKYIEKECFHQSEPFYSTIKNSMVKKLFSNLEEFHVQSCPEFNNKDLLALSPSNCLYVLTPVASMINEKISLLEMFPKLIRINIRCISGVLFSNLINWLFHSSATQFDILDQEFSDFTIADLILKLISLRIKETKLKIPPVNWIRLSLVHKLLPSRLLPELSELLTNDTPPVTLIIDICDDEISNAWTQERNSILKKCTSLDIVID